MKIEIPFDACLPLVMQRMREDGLLLVTANRSGRPNVMTIGWGGIGPIWARPCFLIMVRPSRYSYTLLEENGDFTVNVAPAAMAETIAYCGQVSGRDRDKFADRGLTPLPGRRVRAPIVAECAIHYECRTLYQHDLVPTALAPAIQQQSYPRGDFHRLYIGEIAAVYANEEVVEKLKTQGGRF